MKQINANHVMHVTEFDQIQVIRVSGLEGATSSGSELFSWKFIHKRIVED